jgi:hypothetical protein
MTNDPNDTLIEQAISAYRERDPSGGIVASPALRDLPLGSREALFKRRLESRIVERALDPNGRSGTVHAVLARLRRG